MRLEPWQVQHPLYQGIGIFPSFVPVDDQEVDVAGGCVIPLGVRAEEDNSNEGKPFVEPLKPLGEKADHLPWSAWDRRPLQNAMIFRHSRSISAPLLEYTVRGASRSDGR